jgi:1,4-alpha-glucan branching enzyme
MASAARRLELRVLRGLSTGIPEAAAERAVRELLAVQASDWAFLDRRGQAGDYPWQRTTGHARLLLEAINSAARPPEPRLRNLAPDLSLSPLLEP